MWLRSFTFTIWLVWLKSSIRRCYHQRTNDVRYASLPYSIFCVSPILNCCNFPDWFEPLVVDPDHFCVAPWPNPCSAKSKDSEHGEIALMPPWLSTHRRNNQWLILEVSLGQSGAQDNRIMSEADGPARG